MKEQRKLLWLIFFRKINDNLGAVGEWWWSFSLSNEVDLKVWTERNSKNVSRSIPHEADCIQIIQILFNLHHDELDYKTEHQQSQHQITLKFNLSLATLFKSSLALQTYPPNPNTRCATDVSQLAENNCRPMAIRRRLSRNLLSSQPSPNNERVEENAQNIFSLSRGNKSKSSRAVYLQPWLL